jgi:hypothetical protein
MSNISTIKAGIESVVQATLGAEYSKLEHIIKIEQNRFNSEPHRWGLRPAPSKEVEGNTQAHTLAYSFALTLTDSYISDSCGDAEVVEKMTELMGLFEDIYKQLVIQKAGAPSIVRLVSGFAISDVFALKKDKIIIVESRFDVRTQISF